MRSGADEPGDLQNVLHWLEKKRKKLVDTRLKETMSHNVWVCHNQIILTKLNNNRGSLKMCDFDNISAKLEICCAGYSSLHFSGDTSTRDALIHIMFYSIVDVGLLKSPVFVGTFLQNNIASLVACFQ